MGMRPSDKDIDNDAREAERFAATIYRDKCRIVMERFANSVRNRHRVEDGPSIGVALAAEYYFIDVFCPGCRQVKQVDLRKIDRHPGMRIVNLVAALSCRDCQPSPPFARLVRITQNEWLSPMIFARRR